MPSARLLRNGPAAMRVPSWRTAVQVPAPFLNVSAPMTLPASFGPISVRVHAPVICRFANAPTRSVPSRLSEYAPSFACSLLKPWMCITSGPM